MKIFCKNLFKNILIVLTAFLCMNMGTGDKTNTMPSPEFVELEEDKGSFVAYLYDEGKKIEVYDFSFSGDTNLAGVRRKNSDAVITLDVSEIKEIVIDQAAHKTKGFQHPKFILASIEFATGVKKDGFLIPEDVVVCGIEKETEIKSAWFLADVEKVVVVKERTAADIVEEERKKVEEKKGFWQKTKDALKGVSKKITG